MSIRAPLRLYERPGTRRFYWRASLPQDLHGYARATEVRLSLHEECRADAICIAHSLNADLPRLLEELRYLKRISMSNEQLPQNYFQLWRDAIVENSKLRTTIERLEQQCADLEQDAFDLRKQMSGMLDRKIVNRAVIQAHAKGKDQGIEKFVEALVFPWPPEKTLPISDLGKAYLASFDSRLEQGKKKPPSPKAREKYQADIGLFVAVMGDLRIGSIDDVLAGQYCQILKQLPANMNKLAEFRGKSIAEILAMKPKPQSEVTISGKLGTLSTMFKWALVRKRQWGIDANPFMGFALDDSRKAVRRPFKHDELLALLKHPTFVKRQFRTAYGYWLIPLGIFTGARLGELCQLDLKDFVEVDGVPCIDINDESENENIKKRLKTENAKRLVPIHPELIRLGLLRYVEKLRAENHVHFFPELPRETRDGPAALPSKWFQKFRARAGLTEKQTTVFHSFRHLFITTLLDGGISPHMVAPLVGHERDLITGKVYWNVRDATKRKPTVDAFNLPADVLAQLPELEVVRLPRIKIVAKSESIF